MAKRVRGTVRPGRRRAATRPQPRPNTLGEAAAPAPAPERRTSGLTSEEERRAAEIEARILEEERSAEEARRRRDSRDSRERLGGEVRVRTAQTGGLAAEASQEYAYVVRDVRRIVLIGGGLIAILMVLFVLIDITHVLVI